MEIIIMGTLAIWFAVCLIMELFCSENLKKENDKLWKMVFKLETHIMMLELEEENEKKVEKEQVKTFKYKNYKVKK
ncbi:hypothetical protein [Leptotrichia trevisanii]|uniref:hypothetical protein n=1 Tax=Leptotrichia trevisanii TaxID=109328 RepID=UPI000408E335|nr:hypothetical protein [Leptotrichia trevisanii]